MTERWGDKKSHRSENQEELCLNDNNVRSKLHTNRHSPLRACFFLSPFKIDHYSRSPQIERRTNIQTTLNDRREELSFFTRRENGSVQFLLEISDVRRTSSDTWEKVTIQQRRPSVLC